MTSLMFSFYFRIRFFLIQVNEDTKQILNFCGWNRKPLFPQVTVIYAIYQTTLVTVF